MTEEDIDFGETVEDALAKLEEIRNKPQPKGVSPEERIAAALEFNNILNMPEDV